MAEEFTREQIKVEAQAIITLLTRQRNAAMDEITGLVGQQALDKARIKDLEDKLAQSVETQTADG